MASTRDLDTRQFVQVPLRLTLQLGSDGPLLTQGERAAKNCWLCSWVPPVEAGALKEAALPLKGGALRAQFWVLLAVQRGAT